MNPLLFRILICAALIFTLTTSAAEAQKTKKTKSVSKTEQKSNSLKDDLKPVEKLKSDFSDLEKAIVAEINIARTKPLDYVAYLEDYKKNMKGNVLTLPNRVPIVMIEGLPAIEDAISDLKKVSKQTAFINSNGLTEVARRHLTDLQENPTLKHVGKDGSGLERRMMKVGFPGAAISENISYFVDDAREVILTMIVDDGLKSRSHRKNVFSPTFKLFGVACGRAKDKQVICVAEFADSFQDKK